MGLVIKVHAVYDTPFWREEGLSGTCFGPNHLVQEIYDNTFDGGGNDPDDPADPDDGGILGPGGRPRFPELP